MKTAMQELFEKYGHLLPDVEKEFIEKEKEQLKFLKENLDFYKKIAEDLSPF